jgi:hypothetical protein
MYNIDKYLIIKLIYIYLLKKSYYIYSKYIYYFIYFFLKKLLSASTLRVDADNSLLASTKVDANSHTYFSPRALLDFISPPSFLPKTQKAALLDFISPPSFLPKTQKANPSVSSVGSHSPPSLRLSLSLSPSISPFLPLALYLFQTLSLSLSLSLSPKIKIHKKFKNPSPLPKIGDSFSFFLSFSSSENDLKAWDAEFVKVGQATLFDPILVCLLPYKLKSPC